MAPATTNYKEIQHDEIEALRSIYMDDFEEEKPKVGAWNVSRNRLDQFENCSSSQRRMIELEG